MQKTIDRWLQHYFFSIQIKMWRHMLYPTMYIERFAPGSVARGIESCYVLREESKRGASNPPRDKEKDKRLKMEVECAITVEDSRGDLPSV